MINQELAYEQWGSYRSPHQKPADFEAFWQKAKQEVENLGLAFQLTPYPFPSKLVEAFELRFQGVGKAEISVGIGPRPAINWRPKVIAKAIRTFFNPLV